MNEDQFDAVKAGDWFCDCSTNGRGNAPYAYFWEREVGVRAALDGLYEQWQAAPQPKKEGE